MIIRDFHAKRRFELPKNFKGKESSTWITDNYNFKIFIKCWTPLQIKFLDYWSGTFIFKFEIHETIFLHFFTSCFIFSMILLCSMSRRTSVFHFDFGLPCLLFPTMIYSHPLLCILLVFIRTICNSHLGICSLTITVISGSSYSSAELWRGAKCVLLLRPKHRNINVNLVRVFISFIDFKTPTGLTLVFPFFGRNGTYKLISDINKRWSNFYQRIVKILGSSLVYGPGRQRISLLHGDEFIKPFTPDRA